MTCSLPLISASLIAPRSKLCSCAESPSLAWLEHLRPTNSELLCASQYERRRRGGDWSVETLHWGTVGLLMRRNHCIDCDR